MMTIIKLYKTVLLDLRADLKVSAFVGFSGPALAGWQRRAEPHSRNKQCPERAGR